MKKKMLFLTTIMLFVVALLLFMPNHVWAAPGENGYIKITDFEAIDDTNDVYIYDATGNNPVDTTLEGIEYDSTTNTLTLNGFKGETIYIEDMGDDFKLQVLNDNEVTGIHCFGEFIEIEPDSWVYEMGKLQITGNGKLSMKGIAGIVAKDLTINDVTIEIIEDDLDENMGVDAFHVMGNLNINSGTISIKNATIGFMVNEDINITGGNISITALESGMYATNINIKGGNLTVNVINPIMPRQSGGMSAENVNIDGGNLIINSENIGIAGEKIKFNGGKTIIDSEMCAVIAAQDVEGTYITLADNMVIEEETSIRNAAYNYYADEYMYFTTFGNDEISINFETEEIINATKKITIKESVNDGSQGDGSTTTPPEKPNKGEKDETPKTGNVAQDIEIIWYASIALILVFGIVTIKSKIKK